MRMGREKEIEINLPHAKELVEKEKKYQTMMLVVVMRSYAMLLSDNEFINIYSNLFSLSSLFLQKFIISCMNKMEQLFQEQRRNLLSMMMYAKQGLPPTLNKESMKQPLKEQNNSSKQPKRNHDISSSRNRNMEKKKKQKHVEDVNFQYLKLTFNHVNYLI